MSDHVGPHLHPVMREVLAPPSRAVFNVVVPAPPRVTPPEPQPAYHPLDLPTVDECLVRIENARARRRGGSGWFTPAREQRAAELLHALLSTAYARDVHLLDFDAATDLPGAVLDTVVLLERVEETR